MQIFFSFSFEATPYFSCSACATLSRALNLMICTKVFMIG